jgi:hypothetical protein
MRPFPCENTTMNPIATAADYADALLVARTARSWIVTLLLLMLLAQLALFLTFRYAHVMDSAAAEHPAIASPPATQPAGAPALPSPAQQKQQKLLRYALGMSAFLALILTVVLSVDLFLVLHVMLVGRLIGVSHVTRAFLWSLVLALMLFPWQAFLNNADLTAVDFKVPGVLFTWDELVRFGRFTSEFSAVAVLRWSRFVGFPVIAMVLLLVINSRCGRGVRLAMGEDQPPEPAPAA